MPFLELGDSARHGIADYRIKISGEVVAPWSDARTEHAVLADDFDLGPLQPAVAKRGVDQGRAEAAVCAQGAGETDLGGGRSVLFVESEDARQIAVKAEVRVHLGWDRNGEPVIAASEGNRAGELGGVFPARVERGAQNADVGVREVDIDFGNWYIVVHGRKPAAFFRPRHWPLIAAPRWEWQAPAESCWRALASVRAGRPLAVARRLPRIDETRRTARTRTGMAPTAPKPRDERPWTFYSPVIFSVAFKS